MAKKRQSGVVLYLLVTWGPGLPQSQFEQFVQVIKAALDRINARAELAIRNLFERHSATLATCCLMQLERLEDVVKASIGVQKNDIIRKAVLLGQKHIALHIYRNPGITFQKLIHMPLHDVRNLNDPNYLWNIVTGSRSTIIQVRSINLTADHMRKLVCRWDPPQALPAARQNDPRIKPMHQYYTLVSVEPDPVVQGCVLAGFKLNRSSFVARLGPADMALISGALPTRVARSGRGDVRVKVNVGDVLGDVVEVK